MLCAGLLERVEAKLHRAGEAMLVCEKICAKTLVLHVVLTDTSVDTAVYWPIEEHVVG